MSKILFPVTITQNPQGQEVSQSALFNSFWINNYRERKNGSTVVRIKPEASRFSKSDEYVVTDDIATLQSLTDGGYLDFVIPLTVTGKIGNDTDIYPYTQGFSAQSIIKIYKDSNNITQVEVKEDDERNSIYSVVEGIAAILALVPEPQTGSGELTDVPVGNTLFVNTLGNDGTAMPNSLAFQYLTIGAAVAAASSGDTVHVFGGTYTEFANLAKQGVKYVFEGRPLVQSFQNIWDDASGAITEIYVKGDAEFRTIAGGRNVIAINGANTKYYIEAYRLTGLGGATVVVGGGTDDSEIRVQEDIDNTGVNYTLRVNQGAKGSVTAKLIDGHQTSGGLQQVLYVPGAMDYDFTVNATLKANQSSSQSTITRFGAGAGKLTVNGDVYDHPGTTPVFFWGEAMIMLGGSGQLTVNGNLYQSTRWSFYRYTGTTDFTLNGNVYNTSEFSVSRIQTGTAIFKINGNIYSTNAVTVAETQQNAGEFSINGKIYNQLVNGNTGEAASISLTTGGSGFAGQAWTMNLPVTGGTGTGMTVAVLRTSAGSGAISHIYVMDPGSGYVVGDVVTVNAADLNATFTVEAIGKTGLMLDRDTGGYDVVIDRTKVVFDETVGTFYGAQAQPAGANKDVIITDTFATNGTTNLINNLVTGSALITDSNIK